MAFERLGYEQISSVLASGNILFRSAETDVPALERTIQQALVDDLGTGGGTIIREHTELRALLDSDPFPGHDLARQDLRQAGEEHRPTGHPMMTAGVLHCVRHLGSWLTRSLSAPTMTPRAHSLY